MTKASPGRAPFFFFFCAAMGCAGSSLDVGSDQEPTPEERVPAEYDLYEWRELSTCDPKASAPIDGTWIGQIVGWDADPGKVVVEFSGMDGNDLCGTVTIGVGEPPPPATDPTAPYPPGTVYLPGTGHPPASSPYEGGFPYTIQGGAMTGDRLSFQIGMTELWRSFCRLQTSYLDGPGGNHYNCVQHGSAGIRTEDGVTCYYNDPANQETAGPCSQVISCLDYTCICDETRCDATYGQALFDLRVDGDMAEGTAEGPLAGGDVEVVFARSE